MGPGRTPGPCFMQAPHSRQFRRACVGSLSEISSAGKPQEILRMTEPHAPLQGVKVVACSTDQAGTVP